MTAIERKVAYVVGGAFYAGPRKGKSKMRLNFTHPANDKIEVGIKALAGVMEEFIAKGKAKNHNGKKKR
jgi:DNA-binding transcriptional MocR family regulator